MLRQGLFSILSSNYRLAASSNPSLLSLQTGASTTRALPVASERWFSGQGEASDEETDPLRAFVQIRQAGKHGNQNTNRNSKQGDNRNQRFDGASNKARGNFNHNNQRNTSQDRSSGPSEGGFKGKGGPQPWSNNQRRDGNRSNNQNDFNHRGRTNNNNRNQNRNNNRNSQQKRHENDGKGDNRLGDLIAQLRKNASKNGHSPNSMAEEGTRRQDQTPSWRQRFNKHKDGDGQSSDRPPSFSRSFLSRPLPRKQQTDSQQQDDGRGRRDQNQRQLQSRQGDQPRRKSQHTLRDSLEFLQGRGSQPGPETESTTRTQEELQRQVTLPGDGSKLSLTETSILFRVKIEDIEKQLHSMGISTDANEENEDLLLDVDALELLAIEFGIETERGEEGLVVDNEELLIQQRRADDDIVFPTRPPVVCIMGHVDHGKTTLMDALRRRSLEQQNPKAKKKKPKKKKKEATMSASKDVAGTEAGGITQIISAFQVDVEGQDSKVTFLDTPGHAAFKSMRQSGSHAADVIVLVVAADDGVSPQTVEIIEFYKSIVKGSGGGISMVVALNKIDKPGIDVDEATTRIENQLLEHGIISESMGGTSDYGTPVQVIPTSGLTGVGLDDLMEGLILQSEVMDLRADEKAHGEGIVMDARMEKGLGVVADCILRWGSMRQGDVIVSGTQASKIRMLKDVNDKMLKLGMPSQPVRIVGFKSLPKAGEPIMCVESEDVAEEMVEQREALELDSVEDRPDSTRDVELHLNGIKSRGSRRVLKYHALAGLDDQEDGSIRIPIIVKADADGSLSAVRESLISLGEDSSFDVFIDTIQDGIGDITASDIQMAKESGACIFAFGLRRLDPTMLSLAETEGVTIRANDIIYSLLDDAKETLGRYLPSMPTERIHGRGSVQAVFEIDGDAGKEKIAGMKVLDGSIYKEKSPVESSEVPTFFRVFRDGKMISPEGEKVKGASLRHFKDIVDSVRLGDECGLGLAGYDDYEAGDEIECYSVEMKAGTL